MIKENSLFLHPSEDRHLIQQRTNGHPVAELANSQQQIPWAPRHSSRRSIFTAQSTNSDANQTDSSRNGDSQSYSRPQIHVTPVSILPGTYSIMLSVQITSVDIDNPVFSNICR